MERNQHAKRAHRKTALQRCEEIHRDMQREKLREQLVKSLESELFRQIGDHNE